MRRIWLALVLLLLSQFMMPAHSENIFRIEATDRTLNRYWEERLLLDPGLFLYANVLPRLVPATEEREYDSGVGPILKKRIDAYELRANMQLNRWGVLKSTDSKGLRLGTRFVPYFEEIAADDEKPIFRVGLTSEAWVVPSDKIQVHLRMRLENHGELYSQFNGRKWDKKITGWIDNAAVYYYNKGLFASIGRSAMIWGPEQRDALLLSDNAPQFDRIWLGYEHRAVRFDYFITRLDDVEHNDSLLVRYISAHRLSFRKHGVFELGLSEVALYGGYNRPIDWRYLNPVTTYYWEQWNRGSDDNIFFGLDLAVYWPRQCRIFGELMIDDFQIDLKSEPHQVGYKIGFDMLEPFGLRKLFTKLSYTRVNTTVYGQNQAQNLYLYYGQPIGYFDGNDQDRILALARYHAGSTLDLELEFQFTRKGEGRIEQHAFSGVPFEDKFPIGVVEKSPSIKATALWFGSGPIEGRVSARYAHFNNYRHVCGDNVNRVDLNLFIAYYLQGLVD
ncbi:MAG: capsule assembly Wzi family protein [Candidatus Zixiibacteriota bacterium]